MQQGDLFAPKPQASGEGKYVVVVRNGQRWFATSRDHRFVTRESAERFLESERCRWVGALEVKLVEECGWTTP